MKKACTQLCSALFCVYIISYRGSDVIRVFIFLEVTSLVIGQSYDFPMPVKQPWRICIKSSCRSHNKTHVTIKHEDRVHHFWDILHYGDVIMTTIASQITSLSVVYSIVYSDADQRKHQSSASLAFVWGIHRDRWIPRTKGQLRGKCFHLMTSSWYLLAAICHTGGK